MKEKKLRAIPEIVLRQEEEGSFIYDSRDGTLKGLNGIGAEIWELCGGELTGEEIFLKIWERYRDQVLSKDSVREEIREFLEQLKKDRLINELE